MLSSNRKLNDLLKLAKEADANLTPEERKARYREQAISWATGQVLLSHYEKGKPDMTAEEEDAFKKQVAANYDARH